MKKMLIAAAIAMAATTASFGAVKANKLGVDFMYSGGTNNIGVWWNITDMVALRPSLGFAYNNNNGTPTEVTSTTFNFGVAVPIYLAKFNALDLYVAPAFNYSSTSTKVTTAGASTSTSSSTIGFSAALGLQVQLIDQVHVFGELGLGYTKDDPSGASTIQTGRTAIGAIFYFN